MTPATAEARAVEAANQAFYDAVETSDLDALESVVLTGPLAESVTVVHPGWPVLRGRREVMRSYALIMANTEYIQFFLTDVEVAVDGDTALVSCTENILTGGPAEDDGSAGELVGGLVVATNVFRRGPGGWRLWSHHGSPVLTDDPDDDTGPGGADDADAEDGADAGGDAAGLRDLGDPGGHDDPGPGGPDRDFGHDPGGLRDEPGGGPHRGPGGSRERGDDIPDGPDGGA